MASNAQPSHAQILTIDSPQLFEAAVERATELLRAGEVVGLPTETVYGLAANALDPAAVARIFELKGRPVHNPIIAHVAGLEMARRCASAWPELAERLARAFWPGPLTIVVPRSAEVPPILTAGGSTVGIRWPNHPFIQAVIRRCNFPLAAPSANLSNRLSPTNARHVFKDLGQKIALIVDGGQSQVGIESTVIDVSVLPARILRPGMIHEGSLLAVTGELGAESESRAKTLKSPGMLQKHYAPRAGLKLMAWSDERDLEAKVKKFEIATQKTHIIAHTHIPSIDRFGGVSVIPHDPEAFARAIYAQLHACDDAGAELIIIESLPETDEWRALRDRLSRACSA